MDEIRKELLRAVEVARMLNVSRSRFYELIKSELHFPRAVLFGKAKKSGEREKRWRRIEIEIYMATLERSKD